MLYLPDAAYTSAWRDGEQAFAVTQDNSLTSPHAAAHPRQNGLATQPNSPMPVQAPKLRRTPTYDMLDRLCKGKLPDYVDRTFIDTQFDFAGLLSQNKFLGIIPPDQIGTEVAIVGGGIGALITAYELARTGLKPVIFEQSERLGGRIETVHFHDMAGNQVKAYADMGAMRFSLSSRVLWHYARRFGLEPHQRAPVAGEVNAKLFIDGKVIDWPAGQKRPFHPFLNQIETDFTSYVNKQLASLRQAEACNDDKKRTDAWQTLLYKFGKRSLRDVLNDVKSSETGKPWGEQEIRMLANIGTGIGGLGAFFDINFIDYLRETVNHMDEDLYAIPGGAENLVKGFLHHASERHDGSFGSLSSHAEIHCNALVSDISYDEKEKRHTIEIRNKKGDVISRRSFASVVVTTPKDAMQKMNLGLKKRHRTDFAGINSHYEKSSYTSPLSVEECQAIDEINMMPSGKMYIRTEKKFWKDHPDMPRILRGTGKIKNLYCMDQDGTDNGVVCVNYSWEDQPANPESSPEDRLETYREEIRSMDPRPDSWAMRLADALAAPMPGQDGKPEIKEINWSDDTRSYGAFKAAKSGQDKFTQILHNQFLRASKRYNNVCSGLFLGGEATTYPTGWAEGPLQKGIEISCGIICYHGGETSKDSPLHKEIPDRFIYP